MLNHISLGVRDVDRAKRFYDAVIATIGFSRVWTDPKGIGYGRPNEERLNLFLVGEDDGRTGSPARFHLALTAPNRAAVDAFHTAALRSGGKCNGPPGLRPRYGDTYYAAFVVDPDGYRLEVVHI